MPSAWMPAADAAAAAVPQITNRSRSREGKAGGGRSRPFFREQRVLESGYVIVGGRPTAAPRSSIARGPWRGVVRQRETSCVRPGLAPLPDGGARRRVPLVCPSPVDADGGFVFASCSSRRRCSSYVVSSMLARLPAAGMGCLVSPPSCPIYSLACWVLGSSETITKRCLVRSRARRGRLAAT